MRDRRCVICVSGYDCTLAFTTRVRLRRTAFASIGHMCSRCVQFIIGTMILHRLSRVSPEIRMPKF